MDKHELGVEHAAALCRGLEMERCLHGVVDALLLCALEVGTILMEPAQEELCLVVAGDGEARQGVLHVLMEPLLIVLLQILSGTGKGIIEEVGGDVGVVLVEVVGIDLGVHEPVDIAEEGYGNSCVALAQLVELGKGLVEFGRAPRVQDYHIGLGAAEGFLERLVGGFQIGDVERTSLGFELLAQVHGENALAGGGVVAIDEDGMMVGESLQEGVDGILVLLDLRLIDLEDLFVVLYLVAADGEGNDHADVVVAAEVGQGLHLLRVERTEDDVALAGTVLQEGLANIGVDGNIPGSDVGGDAGASEAVAGQEHAAIVFHHAAAVAVDIMQGQHHSHTNGSLTDVCALRLLGLLALSLQVGRGLGERDEDGFALLQLVVVGLHSRIGCHKFVYRKIILLGDAVDGVFLFCGVDIAPLCCLGKHRQAQNACHDNENIPEMFSHFLLFCDLRRQKYKKSFN